MAKTFDVIVSGVVVTDHHVYEGERFTFASTGRDLAATSEAGGAALVQRLLTHLIQPSEKELSPSSKQAPWRILPGVAEAAEGPFAYALWQPCAAGKGRSGQVWRTKSLLGFGTANPAPAKPANAEVTPRIMVLDEAGQAFRSKPQAALWHLPKGRTQTDWIVLKMAGPIAQGDLWFELTERHAERLVCVISADDLRQECVNLSLGLSWERTLDEMRAVFAQNPALERLNRCRHLIVRFRTDGALWIDRNDPKHPRAVLVYDAANAEGSWDAQFEGGSAGYSSALTASLTYALMQQTAQQATSDIDLIPAIKAGLRATRDLLENGHGPVGKDRPCGFPAARLAKVIQSAASEFSVVTAPFPIAGKALPKMPDGWSIVELSQHPAPHASPATPVGLAQQIVLQGTAAYKRFPHASFGFMTTLDRVEIEALRGIRRMMLAYHKQEHANKPLSIGVFGPPGAGKSFGVKQLANEVFGKQAWLEFNLSQFNGPGDLMGAFHQVRDKVLSGITPVVFWDEFDSQEYTWLQFLLAPMQDGRFQEGQLNHAIGKCVFVFAGGTSATFAGFGPPADDDAGSKRFRLLKGPDFHSRLDAFYNVLGPNQRQIVKAGKLVDDPADICHPLRRALLIRALIGCKGGEKLDFDSDLLNALLLVPRYKHGARSLEKLVSQLKPPHGGAVRRSNLPAAVQLAMHVDADAFQAILNRNEGFRTARTVEPLAEAIHEHWRQIAGPKSPTFAKPFAALDGIAQEDNRAAARRIPEVLALAGMQIADGKRRANDPSTKQVGDHIEHHLEILAEAEHDGWMDHRLRNGWRLGPRDDAQRLHPLLIPYVGLPEPEKDKDRRAVRHYPAMVARAGYHIVWA